MPLKQLNSNLYNLISLFYFKKSSETKDASNKLSHIIFILLCFYIILLFLL